MLYVNNCYSTETEGNNNQNTFYNRFNYNLFLDDLTESEEKNIEEEKRKLSEYVLSIIEHYKQKDPVGLPGTPIPEPLLIPPLKHSVSSFATMHFKDVQVYGLSKFVIDYIEADLASMEVRDF